MDNNQFINQEVRALHARCPGLRFGHRTSGEEKELAPVLSITDARYAHLSADDAYDAWREDRYFS